MNYIIPSTPLSSVEKDGERPMRTFFLRSEHDVIKKAYPLNSALFVGRRPMDFSLSCRVRGRDVLGLEATGFLRGDLLGETDTSGLDAVKSRKLYFRLEFL